ncbi:hypothetical protein [Photobacterium phosphoreum]|uniref:hypothetical protein n=1 Tax=Photobacterium phosphoreum TaxID=659 RepID=UPI0005D30A2B|nr:hypothetical protein [Photobacterium phosphoreum]KJF85737.1 hypothetical protein UB41_13870 [Photobacterium phosphoreum]PQJ90388.1 hypothetical protein BTO21_01125 [Photobacterium phosphoreum]PSV68291.1 hypothetical protein CTM77_17265 [Photobacterium phosphoreum]
MNNPFESIRKLALSKLSQFKFIMTIVMYLAAVIPLLSLGYLMGKTTPEASKWLLDLSSLLGSIGSLLGGLATVFAAWVAFGAYGAWKKQITHPEMFQNHRDSLLKLEKYHAILHRVVEYDVFNIDMMLFDFQGEIDSIEIGKRQCLENKDEIIKNYESKVNIVKENLNSYGFHQDFFIDIKTEVILKNKKISISDDETLVLMNRYYNVAREINKIVYFCLDLNNFSKVSYFHHLTFKSIIFKKEVNIHDINGDYVRELNFLYDKIIEEYNKDWML